MITATVSQIAILISLGLPFVAKADITWYNPALGGINCFVDCEFAGHRVPVAGNYGKIAACPMEFIRGTRFVISGSGPHYGNGYNANLADGEWQCWDGGNKVKIGYDSFSLDLMTQTPLWREKLFVTIIPPPMPQVTNCDREFQYEMERTCNPPN